MIGMVIAEARVRTERPSRYLGQLCRHADQMSRHPLHRPPADAVHAPPEVRHVEWSDTHGTVELSTGRWTLQATADTLTLRAEAANDDDLQLIQSLLRDRLERIGRRDRLAVAWQRVDSPETASVGGESAPTKKRRSPVAPWILAGLVVLFVAVHLGLGGAALAATSWTVWTIVGLAAILLMKIIMVRLLTTRHHALRGAARHVLSRIGRHRVRHEDD
jgi:hypothetical protein